MGSRNVTVPTPRLIPARRAAAEYGLAYTSLRDLHHRGELAVIKVGKAWYFERADLEQWIQQHKEASVA